MSHNTDPDSESIRIKHGNIPVEYYSDIDLLPTMEFSMLDNILKDKTIAVCRKETSMGIVTQSDFIDPQTGRVDYEDYYLTIYDPEYRI